MIACYPGILTGRRAIRKPPSAMASLRSLRCGHSLLTLARLGCLRKRVDCYQRYFGAPSLGVLDEEGASQDPDDDDD